MLRWLLENRAPLDERACVNVARYGYLKHLKLLRKYDCPWGNALEDFASHDNMDCMIYCFENEAPYDWKLMSERCRTSTNKCFKYINAWDLLE
jgi:hypothetical protein